MLTKLLLAGLLALLPCVAAAQDTPSLEVFGGYSYFRANPGAGLTGTSANGWNGSATWNWNRRLGFKGDFDGHYCCNGQKKHDFLFGPQFSFRHHGSKESPTNIFFHALAGVSHASAVGVSDNDAAWALGGGADFDISGRFVLRLFQIDYVGTHFASATQHHLRYSGGVVMRFGKK
jgi:opacity protein-like surface antigen